MTNSNSFNAKTRILHTGVASAAHSGVVNIPVYRASTILSQSLDELHRRENTPRAISYARKGTPASHALEDLVCTLDGSAGSMTVSSGVQAIALSMMAFLQQGDHILIADSVYAPVRKFCSIVLKNMGVDVEYIPPRIGAEIAGLVRPNTRLVFCESPGSHSFEIQDIPMISQTVRQEALRHGGEREPLIVADVTWSGLVLQRPFDLGIDVTVQSASKYPCGYADVTAGFISAKTEALMAEIRNCAHCMGCYCSGDDTYLLLRGIRTLSVRLAEHERSALEIARWLSARPEIARVNHPGLEPANDAPETAHADHALWKRDFQGSCGLFSIEFTPRPQQDVKQFIEALKLFGIGFSFGGYESLAVPSNFSHRTACDPGFAGPVVRLHVGLEDTKDLIADLTSAFAKMSA